SLRRDNRLRMSTGSRSSPLVSRGAVPGPGGAAGAGAGGTAGGAVWGMAGGAGRDGYGVPAGGAGGTAGGACGGAAGVVGAAGGASSTEMPKSVASPASPEA